MRRRWLFDYYLVVAKLRIVMKENKRVGHMHRIVNQQNVMRIRKLSKSIVIGHIKVKQQERRQINGVDGEWIDSSVEKRCMWSEI